MKVIKQEDVTMHSSKYITIQMQWPCIHHVTISTVKQPLQSNLVHVNLSDMQEVRLHSALCRSVLRFLFKMGLFIPIYKYSNLHTQTSTAEKNACTCSILSLAETSHFQNIYYCSFTIRSNNEHFFFFIKGMRWLFI